MNDLDARCLAAFPLWLQRLGADVRTVTSAADTESLEEAVRRYLLRGVNYVFKSLDLIPDGILDLGYLDDAFVLRVCASSALRNCTDLDGFEPELKEALQQLADEASVVSEFLGSELLERLTNYIDAQGDLPARGRNVSELIADASLRGALCDEAAAWASGYESPGFAPEEKNLIKLRAFLSTKLPV
jgi:uncharacterized membrane protein YkvA (DUF1232 family)